MMNPKISIIVPVYNVENYVRNCIESILAQTYTNYEAIIIDDGSTDNSGIICDQYAFKDNRIKVYHKINEGVSIARNFGLEKAKGEWVCFIDSDDWIKDETLEYVSKYWHNKDLIQFGYQQIDDISKETINQSKIPSEILEINNSVYFSSTKLYHPAICGYIIKMNIIKANNITFPIDIKYGEDQAFIIKALISSHNILVLNKHLYFYRDRIGSTMNSGLSILRAIDHLKVIENISKYIPKENWYKTKLFHSIFKSFVLSYFWIATRSIHKLIETKLIHEIYNQYSQIFKKTSIRLYRQSLLYNSYLLIIAYYIYVQFKNNLRNNK